MAKKKKKHLTKNQALWEKEFKLLKNRARTWQSKHRMLFEDFPTKPKKISEKDIQALHNIRFKKFTEEQKESYRENYEDAYETGRIPDKRKDKKPYEPPTQDDFEQGNDTPEQEEWEETDNEPVHSDEEIRAFIEDIINSILDCEGIDYPNYEVRDVLWKLLDNLRWQLGDRDFYEYMSNGDTVTQLHDAAYEGMSTSPTKGVYANGAQKAINDFILILNRGKPLDQEQAENLSWIYQTHGYEGFVWFEAHFDEEE